MHTNKYITRSMLLIAVSILSALIVSVGIHSANAQIGIVKSYGSGIGQPQPYEPVGPYIDGIAYPQFLITQDNEWAGLKTGTVDIYDFAMTGSQLSEYNTNICVTAPDAPSGTGLGGCPVGQGPIQHEIAITTISALDKWQIDFQTQMFPSNVLAFRQAIAWITDKESWASTGCGGLCQPIYNLIPAGLSNFWLKQSYQNCQTGSGVVAGQCYGRGLPLSSRIAVANSILDNAGFTIGASGFRENHRSTCGTDPGGCGALFKPFYYVRSDDVLRLALGRIIEGIMAGTGTAGLSIQMTAGCTNSGYPSPQNYCETTRSSLRPAVFGANNYNMYTGGWSLTRDPTGPLTIYDPLNIFPFGPNNNRYNDPIYTSAERGVVNAPTQAIAQTFAFAAEDEYNATLPTVDVWSTHAPFAYRVYHADSDPVLNGLQWAGIDLLLGVGWNQPFTFLNAQLIGAPVHNPAHPLFLKYAIKTDVLDEPNPIQQQFLYDLETSASNYDTLNNIASDDSSFAGDLPWMSSLPVVTANIANGGTFPDGSKCVPDAPATGCQALTVQLRPDLSFAASLDGSIAATPVTPEDVVFSTLLARDDPGSFISGAYFDLQNVLDHAHSPAAVPDANTVLFEFRNQAIWNRHNIGATPVESIQHWCTEAHMGNWPGTTSISDCFPIGYPNGPTDFTGSTTIPPASTTSCNLDFNDFGIFSCPWPKSPQASGDSQCTESAVAPTCFWSDNAVSVTSSGTQNSNSQTAFTPGNPVGVDLGSFAFVYDSKNSFTGGTNGPMVFRTREGGFTLPGYTSPSPSDGYFINVGGTSFTLNGVTSGWYKFHQAGDVAWYCTTCAGGTSETGPLPSPIMVINIVDLSLVAAHFGQTPGLVGFPYGHAAWDLSGSSGTPDGTINIFDLTRVALHFGQSFLGGADAGGGAEGTIPAWVFENIPGT